MWARFSAPLQTAIEAHRATVQWVPGGCKAAGAWRWPSTSIKRRGLERVKLTSTPPCVFKPSYRENFNFLYVLGTLMTNVNRPFQRLPRCMRSRKKDPFWLDIYSQVNFFFFTTILVHQNSDFLYFVLSRQMFPIFLCAKSFIGISCEFGYIWWTGI